MRVADHHPGGLPPGCAHLCGRGGLGYFLELWGTTRACWTYYTLETPPLFAVLAHGLAAVAFWRARLIFEEPADRAMRFARRGLTAA